AGYGGAVEDGHLDFRRLGHAVGVLAAVASAEHGISDPPAERHHGEEDPDQKDRLGEPRAAAGDALTDPLPACQFGQARLAPLAPGLAQFGGLTLGLPRFLEAAQFLGPLGSRRGGRVLALGVALRRGAGPLAEAAD